MSTLRDIRSILKASLYTDKNKIKALSEFLIPKSVTELKSFLGLGNQLGNFTKKLSQTSSPVWSLLKNGIQFQWIPSHSIAFEATKQALCNPESLAHFDPSKITSLQTDVSKNNWLGYTLLQQHAWRTMENGSMWITVSSYPTLKVDMRRSSPNFSPLFGQ